MLAQQSILLKDYLLKTTIKKILIFGLPRSGTTVLQKHLGRTLGITGYSEPFSDNEYRITIGDPYQWVSQLSSCVIKVLSQNLDYIDLTRLISVGNFDSIVVTHRSSLTDLIISLYYAEQVVHQYHYTHPQDVETITPFVFPLEFINSVMVPYQWYQTTINELDKNLIPYTVFDYDKYQAEELQIINGVEFCLSKETEYGIDTVSANISYSKICLNYNEIKTAIDKIVNEDHS